MWLCKRDLSKECDGKYKDCTDCVLDNIRAEIEQFVKNPNFGDLSIGASCGAMKAIEIINKYKVRK